LGERRQCCSTAELAGSRSLKDTRRQGMSRIAALFVIISIGSSLTGNAQQSVSAYDSHFRIYAILEKDGKGTKDDPFRPKYLPNPKAQNAPGVKHLGWTAILSPDRKSYFVEIVADKQADLQAILQAPKAKCWIKSLTSQDVIQQELAKFNPKARIERLKVMAQ
jgi:hypothetical protein